MSALLLDRFRRRTVAGPGTTVALALVVAFLVATSAGCATWGSLPQEPGTHPRLTPTTYLEEGNLVALAVDTSAVARRDPAEFIPISVSLANKGLPRLTVNRESFTLVDESGNRYPLASVQEQRTIGNVVNADYKIAEYFYDVVATNYQTWIYQNSAFFPVVNPTERYNRGRGVLRERVELNNRMWMAETLYFPHPKGVVAGKKFELWVSSPELPEPVFVKFRVK